MDTPDQRPNVGAAGLLALEVITMLLTAAIKRGVLDKDEVTDRLHVLAAVYEDRSAGAELPMHQALFQAVSTEADHLARQLGDFA